MYLASLIPVWMCVLTDLVVDVSQVPTVPVMVSQLGYQMRRTRLGFHVEVVPV